MNNFALPHAPLIMFSPITNPETTESNGYELKPLKPRAKINLSSFKFLSQVFYHSNKKLTTNTTHEKITFSRFTCYQVGAIYFILILELCVVVLADSMKSSCTSLQLFSPATVIIEITSSKYKCPRCSSLFCKNGTLES